MSISITCTISGDLDNPRHRKAAEDIHNAIRNAIASQDGIGHMPERLSMNETKTSSQWKGLTRLVRTNLCNQAEKVIKL